MSKEHPDANDTLREKGADALRARHERRRSTGKRQRQPAKQPSPALPELVINEADPTATAKELAALIAARDDFLFNGHAPGAGRGRGRLSAACARGRN